MRRLEEDVATAPLRYAPFHTEVMRLVECDAASALQLLSGILDEKCWKMTPFPGVHLQPVQPGPTLTDTEVFLVRFAAGASFPRHTHRGRERVLVLEGGYVDDQGVAFNAGDIDEHDAETSHTFRALPDEPCITISVLERGIDFEAWPWRAIMKLLGR